MREAAARGGSREAVLRHFRNFTANNRGQRELKATWAICFVFFPQHSLYKVYIIWRGVFLLPISNNYSFDGS